MTYHQNGRGGGERRGENGRGRVVKVGPINLLDEKPRLTPNL